MTNFCSQCGSSLSSTTKAKTSPSSKTMKSTPKRKPSAYSAKYSKAFKSLANKNKKKDGSWKKNGYKTTVKQAHKKAKGMRK